MWVDAGVYEVYRLENLADVINYLVGHWVFRFPKPVTKGTLLASNG